MLFRSPYCQSANYPILVIRSSPGSSISERNSTVRSATHRFLHGSITAKLPSWITQTLITKPRLKAAATATICAMIAVVSWGVSVAIPRGQPRSALLPTPPDERPVRVESDPPMPPTLRRWVDEFGFVPIDLRWPGRKGFGKGEIEEDLKSLVIQTQDCNRLVKLGEYSASDRGFTVALDVSPQSSEGEFGIFFGFQSEKDDRPKLWQYQVIQLQVRSSRQVPSLRVSRYLAKLKSENQPIAGYHNQSMDMELPHPLRIRMEVQVEHNRLTSVTICGQQCDPLSIVTLNDQYSDSDYFGGFGVFAENATVWFSNPKFVRRN